MSESAVFFVECEGQPDGLVLELSREENTDTIIEKARENFGLPQKVKLDLWLQLTASPKLFYVPHCVGLKGLRFSDPIRAHIRRCAPKEPSSAKGKPKETKNVKQEPVTRLRPRKEPATNRGKAKDNTNSIDLNNSERPSADVRQANVSGAAGGPKPIQPTHVDDNAEKMSKKGTPLKGKNPNGTALEHKVPTKPRTSKKRPSKAVETLDSAVIQAAEVTQSAVVPDSPKPPKKKKKRTKAEIPLSKTPGDVVNGSKENSIALNQATEGNLESSRLDKAQTSLVASNRPRGSSQVSAKALPPQSNCSTESDSERENETIIVGNEQSTQGNKDQKSTLHNGQSSRVRPPVSNSSSSDDSESDSDSSEQKHPSFKQVGKPDTLQRLLDGACGNKANGLGNKKAD